jgi:hypothetical protein
MNGNRTTRREFIGCAAAIGVGALVSSGCSKKAAKRWYKGNLHMHTFWSDGRAFPEEAVEWYRSRGYSFVGLSDHNVFQDNPARWVSVVTDDKKGGKVKRGEFESYLKAFSDAEVRKTKDGGTEVRLRTFAELSARFDKAGEFLLIPDVEATRNVRYADGVVRQLHMNYVNLPKLLDSYTDKEFKGQISDRSIEKALGDNAAEVDCLAKKLDRPRLFILNHPIWTWYDVGPEAFLDNPAVRYFELCNNGSPFAPANGLPVDGFDTDRLWDVVNAFRVRRGQPLLYGIGTDDTHHYRGEHGKMLMPGNAWSLVRSESLSVDALIEAMDRGDFVTCEGLEPEDVSFDTGSGTLEVSVAAKKDTVRTVRFIVTKKDFSEKPVRTVTVTPSDPKADQKRFRREINVYDERIGSVAKSVESAKGAALNASYTMSADDLYVRARIEEDGTPLCSAALHPQGKFVAWTQPYVNRRVRA